MEKRKYQIFVSSTYKDLIQERDVVMRAILENGWIPVGMELFPASNDDAMTLIKKVVDDCDYYVLILGGRYGSLYNSDKSYTQLEYEYAKRKKKPIISFVVKDTDQLQGWRLEKDYVSKGKLEEFTKTVTESKNVKYWQTPDELGRVVQTGINMLIEQYPAVGWVKATSPAAADGTKGAKKVNKQIDDLKKEIADLKKKNKELEEQLKVFQMPVGAEKLAHGKDQYTVGFSYEYNISSFKHQSSMQFSWDELLSLLGSYLNQTCSESILKKELEEIIRTDLKKIPDMENRGMIDAVHLHKRSFNQIIIQFTALGYIPKTVNIYSGESVFGLTEYGRSYFFRECAIK